MVGRTVIQQEVVSPDENIIDVNIELTDTDINAVNETQSHLMSQKCRNDYCNRIMAFIRWLHDKYPAYYEQGVVELSNEEKADRVNYGTGVVQTHDLVYDRINCELLKAFISCKRYKANGNEYGYDNMRKYVNAVVYGASRKRQSLPQNFRVQMKPFMDSLKQGCSKVVS